MVGGSTPAPPDYGKSSNWAALPDRQDTADSVPENSALQDGQSSASADVFFIHPTTYYRSYSGNADVQDDKLNEFTDDQSMRKQASVFNGSARVYAPRYRQAALHNFFKRDASKSRKAFEIAYADVRRAFVFYLENYNNGRPVIIAGHSQGSMHGAKLVKEFFDGTDLQPKLIAAYLIGYNIPKQTYNFLPVCEEPGATGCIVSFNTYGWEASPNYVDYSQAICVNPLSWKQNDELEGRAAHRGGVPRTFDGLDANMIDCKCNRGILWISKPKERGYLMMGGKNYHLMDYHLFYMDLRSNVEDRIGRYLQ